MAWVTPSAVRTAKVDWNPRVKCFLFLFYTYPGNPMVHLPVNETDRKLNNKVSWGGFTAAFLVQCLDASGAMDETLD